MIVDKVVMVECKRLQSRMVIGGILSILAVSRGLLPPLLFSFNVLNVFLSDLLLIKLDKRT